MLEAVIDSTVLVSALLTRGGVAALLIQHAKDGVFLCHLAEEIIAETERVLHYPELVEQYRLPSETSKSSARCYERRLCSLPTFPRSLLCVIPRMI
jgi:predicted nucleic acid-binding protein